MKRRPELQPLSREHHDGLLFSWKIRQGLKNNTSLDSLASFTGWYWKNHIRPHFFQEEKILFACLPDHPMMNRVKAEHDLIRELVINIDQDPDSMDMIRLADIMETHIRFEERELFPSLETQLSPSQLAEVKEKLDKHSVSCEIWTEEFWRRRA